MQLAGTIKASSESSISHPEKLAQALAEIINSQTSVRVNVNVYLVPKSNTRGPKWRNSKQ